MTAAARGRRPKTMEPWSFGTDARNDPQDDGVGPTHVRCPILRPKPERSLYDVLMVSPYADHEFIASAYRILAKRYHPDCDASPGAVARMAELNEAQAILSDHEKRARYDEIMGAASEGRPSPSAPGAVNLRYRDGGWSVRSTADRAPDDSPYGEAGPPPVFMPATGTRLAFGRYTGWTISQVRRVDPDYLAWLARIPAGRTYRIELDAALKQAS
jgi:hypothetical protein